MPIDAKRQKVFKEAEKWSKRLVGYDLKVNNRKTVYMEMNVTGTLSLDDQLKDPKVDRFTYLGSMLQQEGGCAKEVNARIQKGWLKWRSISGVMCDKKMPIWLKSKAYISIVRSVLLYGSETWALNATEENLFQATEMRMIRWSLEYTKLDHMTNDCLRAKMGIQPMADLINENRLRWYGHILRRETNDVIENNWT
ncbi:uncharacterized protein LOC135928864 [Gordionus sp. m RMFG-2023]|uniref:uncharacterized protein LOC135928864 n=1 Tax=Gordionus sp. m RMFG-2023 TaxID=3053472 RepID=UPI0031FBF8DB